MVAMVVACGCGRLGFAEREGDGGDPETSTAFSNLCTFDRVTTIENGLSPDDGVGADLVTALIGGCGVTPVTRTVSQDEPGILDPATGRPLLPPDDLAVNAGGDGPNRAIRYLLEHDTPVVWESHSSIATYRERSTNRVIATGTISDGHDYGLIMVVREPIGGTRVLSAQGMAVNGTLAAGFWFATRTATAIATDAAEWILIEWTDTDHSGDPSTADRFDVIESGRAQ